MVELPAAKEIKKIETEPVFRIVRPELAGAEQNGRRRQVAGFEQCENARLVSASDPLRQIRVFVFDLLEFFESALVVFLPEPRFADTELGRTGDAGSEAPEASDAKKVSASPYRFSAIRISPGSIPAERAGKCERYSGKQLLGLLDIAVPQFRFGHGERVHAPSFSVIASDQPGVVEKFRGAFVIAGRQRFFPETPFGGFVGKKRRKEREKQRSRRRRDEKSFFQGITAPGYSPASGAAAGASASSPS